MNPPAKRGPRVAAACQRCRRQKLKCDRDRPCALCIRASVPCITQDRQKRRQLRQSKAQSQSQSQLQEQEQGSQPQDESLPEIAVHRRTDETWFISEARTSSAGMTQEIIDQFSPKTVLASSISALPGGAKANAEKNHGNPSPPTSDISVREAIGFDLPPKPIADALLETYLRAVHWFMLVFHEPTFRGEYEAVVTSQRCLSGPRSRHQLLLILLVLSLGAHYYTAGERRNSVEDHESNGGEGEFDMQAFRTRSLAKIEGNLLDLLDGADVEAVQACVLLGSFYLYHGRPNLAYVVLGAGIRCSEIMGLARESGWRRSLSEHAREDRRRTFWALYVFDRFASIVYGRPCCLRDEEIEVCLPENRGDTTLVHPAFRTVLADSSPVTTFTYVKCKIQLYRIASPIVADIYFHKNADRASLAAKVGRIDQQLRRWFAHLPPELKLKDLHEKASSSSSNFQDSSRLFMLQALALQLAYDNVQILLHRPLLLQTDADDEFSSRSQCWNSAIQSSNLGVYGPCLEEARDTHAAAFMGINLFTASMVLCVFAMSNPISSQAQLAKQAVKRIMSLSRFLAHRALLSDQTNHVLRDLVQLIFEKEMKAMLETEDIQLRQSHQSHQNQIPESIPDVISPTLPEDGLLGFPDFGSLDFHDGIATLQQAMFPDPEWIDVGTPRGIPLSSIGQTWVWNPFSAPIDDA
ncbi:hypothetical protein ASPZODRAFT_90464 [Penicilliopsis zonata CBS 506.65]|uniref:Zn(2)-C6 fungal-type domain-containing protein n=1 Tax=Penicilliopsis zonata CBS 506.65 TaxID=1073090 RepID=A0A1L9STB0_9EURO|nr:hypothetical protein ASPZODRAFT_90464 [Penicilliopsis zonata CBS 506.65]OJJ50376.1 hypothetical protein ASPZODRAFT_90464 [Penicilliopsis zonata CBS 506.65]